jgi:hypothetical protein
LLVLSPGGHSVTATVNPDHKIFESDFDNNSFSRSNVFCD